MRLPTTRISKTDLQSINELPKRRRLARDTLLDGDAMFGALFNHASIGFAVTDADGYFKRVNPALCKMLGYGQNDLLGRRLLRIIVPTQWRRLLHMVAMIQSGKKIHDQHPFDCVDQQGNRICSLIDLSLVDDSDSVARFIIVQVNNVSRLEPAKRGLEERHLRSLMESASNFVLFRLRNNPLNQCQPQPVFISPSIEEIVDLGNVFEFQSWVKMIHPDDVDQLLDMARKMLETRRMDQKARIMGPGNKGWRWLRIICVAVTDEIDGSLFFNGIILDITTEMNATAALKASEKELKDRTESLSEVNTALEVLLRKREADRMDVEDEMLGNAKNLILPYLEKLKASRLDDRQRVYLNLVESNLNELISPLSQRMARHYLNFTPLEIQVANLVKEGKTTKDIAQILRLSVRTIEAVRYTIRRKLGLKKKRANLRSHLLSIDGSDTIARGPNWSG